jgi:hypothetical protein
MQPRARHLHILSVVGWGDNDREDRNRTAHILELSLSKRSGQDFGMATERVVHLLRHADPAGLTTGTIRGRRGDRRGAFLEAACE